jgi:hypothetical protein
MKLSAQSPRSSVDGTIRFPILECWNPLTECVSIAADVNGRRILCRVAGTVLRAQFPGDGSPTETVVANRSAIEAAAASLITRKRFAKDGMIDIHLEDLRSAAA